MEVFMILPKSTKDQVEIRKQLARFHADHAVKMVERMPCPTEQKMELMDRAAAAVLARSKHPQENGTSAI